MAIAHIKGVHLWQSKPLLSSPLLINLNITDGKSPIRIMKCNGGNRLPGIIFAYIPERGTRMRPASIEIREKKCDCQVGMNFKSAFVKSGSEEAAVQ